MPFPPTHDGIFQLFHWVFCGIGIPLNLLTLYLVVFKSRKVMSSYRLFLANSTFASLLLNLIIFLIQPKMIVQGNVAMTILLGIFISPDFCYLMTVAALICVCYEYVAMTSSFIFRYLVLCHKDFIASKHGKTLLVFCGVFVVFDGSCFVALFFVLHADNNEIKANVLKSENAWIVSKYSNYCGIRPDSPFMTVFYCFVFANIVFYFVIAWICRQKILFYLNTCKKKISPKTFRSQKRLITTLTLQALIPSVIILPAAILYVFHAVGILGTEYVPHLLFFLLQKASLASPIINLVSIDPYRIWILNLCQQLLFQISGKRFNRKIMPQATAVTFRDI